MLPGLLCLRLLLFFPVDQKIVFIRQRHLHNPGLQIDLIRHQGSSLYIRMRQALDVPPEFRVLYEHQFAVEFVEVKGVVGVEGLHGLGEVELEDAEAEGEQVGRVPVVVGVEGRGAWGSCWGL